MLNQDQITAAITALKAHQIVILPTDTIYGFSVLGSEKKLIPKINELKKADLDKPLILLVANRQQIPAEVQLDLQMLNFLESAQPTTVIFPTTSGQTLALRLVQRADLKKILEATGPIWSTSVNYHGQVPATTLSEITALFPDILLFFDEPLAQNPSKIYNSITKKWVR